MVLEPIDPNDLRSKLRLGIVSFAFKKLDGNLRTAVGTTSLDAIPVSNHPTGTRPPTAAVTFFDISKNAWRSLSPNTEVFISK